MKTEAPKPETSVIIPFAHRQSAHCENGTMANLLTHHGLKISEAMVFGIGSGLFFGYLPFIRLNHLPLTSYRTNTGAIMNRTARCLGVEMKWKKFRDPRKAMDALDQRLNENIPVGCRTGAYWLTYFPRRYRFHFNMHNLVVFGKEGDEYLISDPVFEDPVRCPRRDLMKARFAKGPLPPKGRMYHITRIPENPDLAKAAVKGIREVCRTMLKAPGPWLGVKGIRHVAGKVAAWPEKLGADKASLYLGQMIRMQEEIGTGGGGFRFIYAAFLQEAAELLENPELLKLSAEMTAIGDLWREFAYTGSRICKNRASDTDTYLRLSEIIRECGERETALYKSLLEAVRKPSCVRAGASCQTTS